MDILDMIKRFLNIGPTTACLECGAAVQPGDDFCSEAQAIDYAVERNP